MDNVVVLARYHKYTRKEVQIYLFQVGSSHLMLERGAFMVVFMCQRQIMTTFSSSLMGKHKLALFSRKGFPVRA